MLAGITIFLLKQANEHLELTGYLVQVIICELASPDFGFASHLFPLAFEDTFIHGSSFGSFGKAAPVYAGARGSIVRRI